MNESQNPTNDAMTLLAGAIKQQAAEITKLTNAIVDLTNRLEGSGGYDRDGPHEDAGEMQQKLKRLEEDIKEQKNQIDSLEEANSELQSKLNKAEETNKELRPLEQFQKLDEVFQGYCDACQSLQIKALLPTDNALHFYARGTVGNVLLGFWTSLCEFRNGEQQEEGAEWNALMETLKFLLNAYNDAQSSAGETDWRLAPDEAGQSFDGTLHQRADGSSQHSGTIKQVLLPGIRNKYGNVKTKSLVMVPSAI